VRRIRRQRKSVLDAVMDQFGTLDARLGREDKDKLVNHLDLVRDIERRIVVNGPGTATCAVPTQPEVMAPDNEETMEAIADAQIGILAVALNCDLTRVATLQFSNAENHIRMPWLSSFGDGHGLSHAGPSSPVEAGEIMKRDHWYATQYAKLLGLLDAQREGDRSVLDNSIVFWGNELSVGATHSHVDMPFIIAGSAGGYFRTGRYLEFDHVSHVNMLLSFLHAMGMEEETTFGDPEFCDGPLAGLH